MRQDALLWLLNSRPVVRGVQLDHLADEAAARRALTTFGVEHLESVSALGEVRHTLQEVARGRAATQDLQRYLEPVVQRPRVEAGALRVALDGPAQLLPAARVVLAWFAVQAELPGRLRPCASTECTKFLIDRSRPGTARWCSMADCGNRVKARRHAARAAGSTPP